MIESGADEGVPVPGADGAGAAALPPGAEGPRERVTEAESSPASAAEPDEAASDPTDSRDEELLPDERESFDLASWEPLPSEAADEVVEAPTPLFLATESAPDEESGDSGEDRAPDEERVVPARSAFDLSDWEPTHETPPAELCSVSAAEGPAWREPLVPEIDDAKVELAASADTEADAVAGPELGSLESASQPFEAEARDELDAASGTRDRDGERDPAALDLLPILEAVLFAAPAPLSTGQFQKIFVDGVSTARLREALGLLQRRFEAEKRGIVLCEIAGGWQFLTREEYFPYVQRIARVKHDDRLTAAAIETLAVVAYRQPISRADVDAIRGVGSAPLIRTLMDRGLVRVTGRAATPGNPFQYGTTPKFLHHFGLRSEKDLPDPRDLNRLLAERDATSPRPTGG